MRSILETTAKSCAQQVISEDMVRHLPHCEPQWGFVSEILANLHEPWRPELTFWHSTGGE